ncbi:DUF4381 domain-containing protein [Reyranella sp.]|uniref:DUF4381 domain-containing protein n=1 Tax=Reyranella sp. TaxID=1929291 RepID=UPI003BA97D35
MNDPADLANLRDLALPPDVSLWPPAPGWWVLAAALLALVLLVVLAGVQRYWRNAYRREALRMLADAAASDISAVLKRAALVAWPRAEVAPLSGEAWLAFLDRSGRTTAFSSGPGRAIETLAFGGSATASEQDGARLAARAWLRDHRC